MLIDQFHLFSRGWDSIRSKPVRQHGDETQGGEKISRELVVTGCDAPPILEAAEATLNDVAPLVGLLVVANALLAIGFAGDDRLDPTFFEKAAKRIGVVSLVRYQFSDARNQAHARFGHDAVSCVARRQYEYPRTALIIDNRMDLAIPTAFGDPYRLCLRPPLPPLAQRWIFT
jgi:hypothetical protein